ncbi:MAG TPA: TonB-dependent receptor [Steroidobacteraceae bacterium]|jgi:outer membrane receptor protein involved in Fe transport|nr:TonB-dependent receptor [Steroidobacteraceae bacterium]
MPTTPSKPLSGSRDRHLLFFPLALAAALLGTGVARATDANSSDTANAQASGSGALEEIVVTATRREESISKVPISITAMSQDMLDQKGIRDITELVRFTPGVSIDTTGTNQISIRGISSSAGAGTTGIYIDDTPIQMRELGFNPDETLPKTFDLERVEVLRGPQGTLFGSGSEGGTIRYIMTQPSVTQESTYVRSEASYTEYGQPNGEAGIAHGGPIIDGVLGYRASIWYRYDGGWINRVDNAGDITESNANYANSTVARLALLWQPSENVKLTPSVLFQNKQQHDLSTYWPAYSDPAAGRFNNATPERIPIPDEYYLPAIKLQVDFDHMTFISNTSYYHRNETDSYQGTGYDLAYYQALGWPNSLYPGAPALGCGSASTTPTEPCSWYPLLNGSGIHMPPGFANYATPNTMTNQQRSWTQEFRLQSSDPDARVKWTTGVFWQVAEELSVEQLNDPNINNLFQALYGVTADSIYGSYYNCPQAGYTAAVAIPNCDIYYNYNKSYDRQIAGFGEATIGLIDNLSLVLGARVSKLGFSLNHISNGYENYGPYPAAGKSSNTAFTPRVGLDWQMDQHNLFYFTYAKGFRPGGFNAPLIPACAPGLIADGFTNGQAPSSYGPDDTQSYEVGSKNNFNNVLKIATSVYYVKWNHIQQNVYVAGNCGLQFTDNLGTAVAKGFDFQADADLGNGFTFDFSAGYTNARFTSNSLGGLAVAGDAIAGNAAINYSPGTSPPWTVAFGPQYAFKAFQHDAYVRVDWEYSSRNPWLAPVQDPRTNQYEDGFSYTLPATSFTSARAGFKVAGWDISAFCDNLFNKFPVLNYAQTQVDSFNPAGPPTPQENDFTYRPRTFGITATFKM